MADKSLQVCHCGWSKMTSYRGLRIHQGKMGCKPPCMPAAQTLTAQVTPAASETTAKETSKSLFETPQRSRQTATGSDKACRALDFSTGAQQEEELLERPTTRAQETVIRPKEKEREAQKLQKIRNTPDVSLQVCHCGWSKMTSYRGLRIHQGKMGCTARQDRARADLQQKIHIREHKVAKVRSSVVACKASLEEDTPQKALRPLEGRRHEGKRDAQDLVQKLRREPGALKKTTDELDENPDLKEILEKLEKLSSVDLKRIETYAVDVKLDPTTAHQCLVLSADRKKVRDGRKKSKVPDSPERFDVLYSVLGLNSFTSGKAYWEVEVSNKTGWDLGVARRDANRKGKLVLSPDDGYWVIAHYEDRKYAAMTAPPVSLSLKKKKPKKVGVFVDYEEGLVSFYDVAAQAHIYSFAECWFDDEIVPYFSLHLKQKEKNVDPLIISAVKAVEE